MTITFEQLTKPQQRILRELATYNETIRYKATHERPLKVLEQHGLIVAKADLVLSGLGRHHRLFYPSTITDTGRAVLLDAETGLPKRGTPQ